MHLQESGEMYLETILLLSQKQPCVRSVDVSAYMGYSKPSVSRAMSLLKQGSYIFIEEDGVIRLTEKGRAVAEKILERHNILTDCLIQLGVPRDTAAKDACKIEHDISDETFAAVKAHVKGRFGQTEKNND